MSDLGSLALFLFATGLTVTGAMRVLHPRPDGGSVLPPGLIGLGIGLFVQGVGHLAGMVTGHQPARPAVQLAYLAVSVALVPAGLAWAGPDRGRWGSAVLTLTALTSAVLVIRIQTTWRPASG